MISLSSVSCRRGSTTWYAALAASISDPVAQKLIEWALLRSPVGVWLTPPSLLGCELAAVGYREINLDRLMGSKAYLAIFTPPSIASRTRPNAMVPCKTS
jgi:hypothetical protein